MFAFMFIFIFTAGKGSKLDKRAQRAKDSDAATGIITSAATPFKPGSHGIPSSHMHTAAPELILGAAVSHKSVGYTAAVLCAILATGKPPIKVRDQLARIGFHILPYRDAQAVMW